MPVTETGKTICGMQKTALAPFMGQVLRDGITHPLAMGFNAMSLAGGDMSVGETLGASVGGVAGWEGTKRAMPQIGKKLPGLAAKASKFLPGWLKAVGGFAAAAAGGMAASEIGQRVGKVAPIWKRKAPTNNMDYLNYNQQQ